MGYPEDAGLTEERKMIAKHNCMLNEPRICEDCYENIRQQLAAAQAEIAELQSCVDMYRDEFLRIRNFGSNNSEVVGLCDRALSDIKRRVPIVDDFAELEKQRDIMKGEIASLKAKLAAAEAGKVDLGKLADALESMLKCQMDMGDLSTEKIVGFIRNWKETK